MAAFWDIIGKAANLFQLFGLDTITLITIFTTCFLRYYKINKERRKLEERVDMLQLLLRCPAGRWILQQQHLELRHLVTNALKDARGIIQSYQESTMFLRVRRGRSMAREFRDLRSSIECYCDLILSINAYLLIVEANHSPLFFRVRTTEVNEADVPPSNGYSIDAETSASASAPDGTHIINIC